MSKHIFISKGTLELGRNRSERRLNAIFDNQQRNNGSDTIATFSSVGTGEVAGLSDNSGLLPFTSSPVYCKYSDWCVVRKMNEKSCINYETCQTYKYYKRFNGLDINQLGI
jgi:hypothetical protein